MWRILNLFIILCVHTIHSISVQDATDQLLVSNQQAGQVAQNFGSLMSKILHSLPRINPYPGAVEKLGFKAQSPPPSSIPYPVKLDDSYPTGYSMKQVQESAANYIVGVAVISLVPLILALLAFLGAFYCCCKSICCRFKGKGTEKVPSKAVRIAAVVIFVAFFLTGLIASAGGNYSINNFVNGATNVGDLAKAMASDAMSLGNNTINNVQNVFDNVVDINHTVIDALPAGSKCTNYINCIKSIFGIVSVARNSLTGNVTGVKNVAKGFFSDGKNVFKNLSSILNSVPNLMKFASDLESMNLTVLNVTSKIPLLNTDVLALNATLFYAKNINFSRINESLVSFNSKKTQLYQNNITSEVASLDSAMNSPGFSNTNLDGLISNLNTPTSTNNATIIAEINALNQSINLLPDLDQLALKIKNLSDIVLAFKDDLIPSLSVQMNYLRVVERDINKTTLLSNMLYVNSTFEGVLLPGITSIRTFNQNVNSSVVKLKAYLPIINDFIASINSTVDSIVKVFNPAIKSGLISLNSSIVEANCIFNILNGIKDINSSIVILPSSVSRLLKDYEDLAKEYASNISNLATSFINPAVDAIDSVGNSVQNLTEIGSLKSQISSTNDTVNSLPDFKSTDSQISNMLALNLTNVLKQGITQFQNVRQSISNIPLDSFNSTIQSLIPRLQSLDSLVSGKDLVMKNLSRIMSNVKSNLTYLSAYLANPAVNPWPPVAGVLTPTIQIVETLKSELANVPSDRSIISGNYSEAESSLKTSVDVNTLNTQISSSGNSLKNEFKESLVKDVLNSLDSFGSTKDSLPNLNSLAQDMRTLNQTILDASSSLNSNLEQFISYESSFLNGAISDTISEVDRFTSLDPSFEDTATSMFQTLCDAQNSVFGTVNDALGQGQSFINQARSNLKSYSSYPNSYESYKQSYTSQAGEYTSPASAGAIVFGIIPMVLFILSIVAVFFKLLKLAKVSALIMCCFVPLYFLLSVPFIFVTTLVGDHCPVLSDAVQSQVSLVLNNTLSSAGGDLASKSDDILDAFKYFTTCAGDPVDPINFAVKMAGKDPNNIASFSISSGSNVNLSTNVDAVLSQFNATTLFDKVSSAAPKVDGDSISLAPSLKGKITNIQSGLVSTLKTILSGIRSLISCSRISALYDGILQIPCGYMLGAFGSLAFIFTFLPFLMIFFVLYMNRLIRILRLQDKAVSVDGRVSQNSDSDESHHSIEMGPRNKKISIHPVAIDNEDSEDRKRISSRNSEIRQRRNTPPSYSDEGEGGANTRQPAAKGNNGIRNSLKMTTMSPPPADSEDSESRKR